MPGNGDSHDLDTLIKKLEAFRAIYRAICAGYHKSWAIREDFLQDKEALGPEEYLAAIERECHNPYSYKEIQAWELAKKYYTHCSETNVELFNAIYQCIIKNSWYTGVRYFRDPGKIKKFTLEEINRTDCHVINNIYYELAYPIPFGELIPVRQPTRTVNHG